MISHGYAVAVPNYRGAPDFQFPSQIHDAKEAVRWVRYHSAEFNLDPDRVAARGFSSGGYLALMLAVTEPSDGLEGNSMFPGVSSSVRCAVDHAGIVDFHVWQGGATRINFLGGSESEVPDVYDRASVTTYLDGRDAPVMSIHGSRDVVVPIEQTQMLNRQMVQSGDTNVVVVLPDLGHANSNPPEMWPFLEEHLKAIP